MQRASLLTFVFAATLFAAAPGAAAQQAPEARVWRGELEVPGMGELEFFVEFDAESGAAMLDIPAQGVSDLPLENVEFGAERVSFEAPQFGASWVAESIAGDRIEGAFSQGGQSIPFVMTPAEDRGAEVAIVDMPGVQVWEGVASLPGVELEMVVTVAPKDQTQEEWVGAIDIPLQGVVGMPLEDIDFSGVDTATFAISPPGLGKAVFTFDIDHEAQTATGEISQGGMNFPVKLTRTDDRSAIGGPRRPQTPEAPFPYERREATFMNPSTGFALAGELIVPKGGGPHPAVVMLTGSGAQDRDETLVGHKPFLVIADHLARHGVASLRFDDRGVGGSEGVYFETTLEDYADDGVAAVEYLTEQPEIDARRIGALGHSEGGAVAPLVAERSSRVSFAVLLAPMAESGKATLLAQLPLMMRAGGAPEDVIITQSARQRDLVDAIMLDMGDEEIETRIRESILANSATPPSEETLRFQVDQQRQFLTSRWFRHLLEWNPKLVLERAQVPMLAMTGSLDTQVPPERNLPVIRDALRSAGVENIAVVELEGLNHLLQPAETGAASEYGEIEITIAPLALQVMTDWILDQTGR